MKIKNIYINYKAKKHKKYLQSVCNWGENFCGSKMYKNSLFQLLNIKIINNVFDSQKIIFGNNCNISCAITLNEKGSIDIGNYVFMNFVKMRIDYHLSIGSHCMFGPNVIIWDTDNHPLSASKRHIQTIEIAGVYPLNKSYESNGGNITIEDDVWIGMDALLLGGITIGKGAIVAARSVVTKDVPPFTIVAGIPAKKIGDVPS